MWDILHNPKIMISVPFLFKNAKDVALGMNYLHLCEPAIIHRGMFLIREYVSILLILIHF